MYNIQNYQIFIKGSMNVGMKNIFPLRIRNVKVYLWYSTKPSYIQNVGTEPLRYKTVGLLLEEAALKHANTAAIISKKQNQTLTFSQTLETADKLAAALNKLDLKKQDRVGIWMPNRTEWYLAFLACTRLGLITVALNPVYEPPDVEYCINKVGLTTIICGDVFRNVNYYEKLLKVSPELETVKPGELNSQTVPSLKNVVLVGNHTQNGTYNFEEMLNWATNDEVQRIKKMQDKISPDQPCNIQFTSGTTGPSKAVTTSHFSFINQAYIWGKRLTLSEKHHSILLQVPLFHSFGFTLGLITSLCYGSTVVLPSDGFDASKSLDALRDEKCSIMYGTPTMYIDLLEQQKQRKEKISCDLAVTGGALVVLELVKQIENVLNVSKAMGAYGLTECTALAFQPLLNEARELTTVGYIHDHLELKVIDESGNTVPMGHKGELCIRGYNVMMGYWNDDTITKRVLGPDRWLKTGDEFMINEDGYGRFCSRIKDIIIRGGENIYPGEIESLLATHPKIFEICVVGLPHRRLGEEVAAFIRTNANETVTLEEVRKFCEGKLAPFKIPSKIKILEEFPKTPTGKLQKFKIKEMFQL